MSDRSRHAPPRRRTQEMRSAETRAKLIDATLDVLLAEGYQNFTTQRVCDVAGVSRGAMLHHFPSRERLLAHAIEHMLTVAAEDIRAQASRVRSGEIPVRDFIDYLWAEHFSNRLFYVTLEHVTIARTDAGVRAELMPVVKRFHQALDETWQEFFHTASLPDPTVAVILNLTLCLLRGMGVQSVLRPGDDSYYGALLTAWKAILAALVGGEPLDHGVLAGLTAQPFPAAEPDPDRR
ncbi:TetR/AcrR family transcriptional regulator [Azospirillum sp. ST 5-10]|uniref:TetR/AcrR family transcriptional regulator n=1 Tax=unclassified Azospirillum TaxID=2630922 RepID=UPI003F49BF1B